MARSEHPIEFFIAQGMLMGMRYDPADHSFNSRSVVNSGLINVWIDDMYICADTLRPIDVSEYALRRQLCVKRKLGASDHERYIKDRKKNGPHDW